ncbi:MAG: aminoacyl-tRNA hydrolase [Flavobacteriaceae bacterium]|nr:aminoacyl-tRNA hydrolase [Flavobacteriaceae bacterium]
MNCIKKLFPRSKKPKEDPLRKFLIVGLGNIGAAYYNTRHNIGFKVLNSFAEERELIFEDVRYGAICKTRFKGKSILLLKPSTLMNLSGKAVRYWAIKENIPLENILIITDDLNLPFGTIRLKPKGSDGGHNGLKDIRAQLNTPNYPRIRFGIQSDQKGYNTVDFVLGKWTTQELDQMKLRIEKTKAQILAFVTQGIQAAMNQYNGT